MATFYIALLQKNKTRYLKIGQTKRPLKRRLQDKDYKKYSTKKIVYQREYETEEESVRAESYARAELIGKKGLKYHKNDRFTYFRLDDEFELKVGDETIMVRVR